jgi:riboflavin biosynthesis RibT protein
MLIRYKKTFEKIAMGLLSFMPNEKDVKKLQQTMKQYESDDDWHLYLWKEGDDIIGLVGICQNGDSAFEILHLTVNPSYRNQGVGKAILKALKEHYPDSTFTPSKEVEPFFSKIEEEIFQDG